ncbi:dolichyl-phosphate-mannose,protein O-mannosyl transferase [Hyaloraphidium curvatum]|nr:dolichyl-phosphate-mannose,protein O-mannosyl transferase [Hyaloraphidium curvatum]
MSDDSSLRRRRGGTPAPATPTGKRTNAPELVGWGVRKCWATLTRDASEQKVAPKPVPKTWWNSQTEALRWNIILLVFLFFGVGTRFWKIGLPQEVVFDEVHFGKFASYYLRRTYFFDVHPPLGKMLIALVGWMVGYNGHFDFDNIGDDYVKNNVPYVALRSLSAILGGLLVPLVVDLGRRLGFGMGASVLAGAMVLFDNALISQSRLILLDSMLIFNTILAAYCWVRFFNERHSPYSKKWWGWIFATGFMLAAAMGIKMVGLFVVALVGIATLVDLWRLLDWRRGMSINAFVGHFMARALGLIVVPLFFYMFWFWLHFTILIRSGPGDAFMSHRFQSELKGGSAVSNSYPVPYYTNVTIRHLTTSVFLHSHLDRYPLRYDDGRVSSAGQQVTGYPHKDMNNIWIMEPADPLIYHNATKIHPDDEKSGVRFVRNGDIVRLLHLMTGSRLITHDVASPLMSTHMEMTTIPAEDDPRRYEETLWRVEAENLAKGNRIRSVSMYVKLVNVFHKVAVHTHTGALPPWGFGQQEINGNKNLNERANQWFVEDVQVDYEDDKPQQRETMKSKPVAKMGFLAKFLELQSLMIHHNAGLTKAHPYQSTPITWPTLYRGISFWERKGPPTWRQIYLLGNPLAWWMAIAGVGLFALVWLLDQILLRKGVDEFGYVARRFFNRSVGYVALGWALHYLPFYIMGRSLFLHHYLPAYVFSCLTTAGTIEFLINVVPKMPQVVFGDDGVKPTEDECRKQWEDDRRLESVRRIPWRTGRSWWIAVWVLSAVFALTFWHFAMVTYGDPVTDVELIKKRQWLTSWDLQFI